MDQKLLEVRILRFIEAVVKTYAAVASKDNPTNYEIRRILPLLENLTQGHVLKPNSAAFISTPSTTKTVIKSRHSVVQYGKTALNGVQKSADQLGKTIRPIIEYAPWCYSYKPRCDIPDIEEKIAFAELLGPNAPIKSDAVCLGLTLIAPRTIYPEHHHPAIELYYVFAGSAVWTKGKKSTIRKPGEFVLHPSQTVHAMETADEPLLAIYTWSGADIRTTSAYVEAHSKPAQVSL